MNKSYDMVNRIKRNLEQIPYSPDGNSNSFTFVIEPDLIVIPKPVQKLLELLLKNDLIGFVITKTIRPIGRNEDTPRENYIEFKSISTSQYNTPILYSDDIIQIKYLTQKWGIEFKSIMQFQTNETGTYASDKKIGKIIYLEPSDQALKNHEFSYRTF